MRKILPIFLCLSSFFIFNFHTVNAAEIINADEGKYILDKSINDDVYIAVDEEIIINEDINGDLFVASGVVRVDGDVKGTLVAAGGMLTINGDVSKNLFVVGGQVEVNGDVSRDLFAGAGSVDINGDIREDIYIGGGQVKVNGEVGDDVRMGGGVVEMNNSIGGDVMIGGGTIYMYGDVDGDVHIGGDDVYIGSENILGDVVFYGKEEYVDISPTSVISGEVKYEVSNVSLPASDIQSKISPFISNLSQSLGFTSAVGLMFKLIFAVIGSLGIIILGVFLNRYAPVRVVEITSKLYGKEMFTSLGIGLLSIPLGLIIILMLGVSIIGWPTLRLFLALVSVVFTVIMPIVSLSFGEQIMEIFSMKSSKTVAIIIGVVLIRVLKIIPCVGWLFGLFVTIVGIGAIVRMKWEKMKYAKELEGNNKTTIVDKSTVKKESVDHKKNVVKTKPVVTLKKTEVREVVEPKIKKPKKKITKTTKKPRKKTTKKTTEKKKS